MYARGGMMSDERLKTLLLDLIEQSHATYCALVALVQMLAGNEKTLGTY